MMSHDAILR